MTSDPVDSDRQDAALQDAVRLAWGALGGTWRDTVQVTPLQRARRRGTRAKGKRTAVLRLEGLGPGGTAVIAKRTYADKAALERVVYEEILPHFSGTVLRYDGCARESTGDFAWLFLEDAGGEPCTFATESQRLLTARWLGLLHLAAAGLSLHDRLPRRGPGFYLDELLSTSASIRSSLDNPVLTREDTLVLRNIVAALEAIERRWRSIDDFCASMPQTVVHGHLEKRNLRVRSTECETVLFVFDWETASLGTPAIDYAQWCRASEEQPAEAYLSMVHAQWPNVTAEDLRQMAGIGALFRMILSIGGVLYGLDFEDCSQQGHQYAIDCARWCMHDLRDFESRLAQSADVVRALAT